MATDLSRSGKSDHLAEHSDPPPSPPPRSEESWTAEERAAFVQRVRDILAGKVPAEPMVTPPRVQAILDEIKREHPRTTREALQRFANAHNLQHYHGGQMVACLDTPQGRIVLACGPAEVQALIQGVPWTERQHVCVHIVQPWGALNL